MAGFSDAVETALLALIFNATAWANYADNAASSPQTNVAVGLHTADPTDSGSMTSSETSYTSYARASVARTSGGWTVTGNSVSPAANIDFATGTGGSGTVTHFSTGKTGGGATAIIMAGTVTPNISVGNGIIPRLTTSTSMTLD